MHQSFSCQPTSQPQQCGICKLHHSSWQYWMLNPLREARDRTHILTDTSQVLNQLSHNVNTQIHTLDHGLAISHFLSSQRTCKLQNYILGYTYTHTQTHTDYIHHIYFVCVNTHTAILQFLHYVYGTSGTIHTILSFNILSFTFHDNHVKQGTELSHSRAEMW